MKTNETTAEAQHSPLPWALRNHGIDGEKYGHGVVFSHELQQRNANQKERQRQMKIELKNNFHNTSAKMHVSDLRIASEIGNGNDYFCTITESQMKRAARKLCGMKDCTCGTVRGPQEHAGRKLIVMHETQHGLVQV